MKTLMMSLILMICLRGFSQDQISRYWEKQEYRWSQKISWYSRNLSTLYRFLDKIPTWDKEERGRIISDINDMEEGLNYAIIRVMHYQRKIYERQNYIPHVKKRSF